MVVLRKSAVINPVNVAIAFLVAGGAFLLTTRSQSKVSECHQLISVVNQGSSLIDQNKGKQAATTNQLARELDRVTQNLAAVNFGDKELKKFQTRFVKLFQALSQASDRAANALDSARIAELTSAGRAKVEKAKPEIEAAGKAAVKVAAQADVLATEINQYCREK